MPGLAGCFALNTVKAPLRAQNIIERITRVQAVPGISYEHQIYKASRLVAVNTIRTPQDKPAREQPYTDADGRYAVLMHGEVHNIAELRAAMPDGKALTHDGAVLLAMFRAKGPDFIGELRGAFSLLIFDSHASEITLFTDHFGSRPIYFYEEKGLLFFGSEKKYVLTQLEQSARLDPVGVLQIFAHVHNLGSRTFIENLYSLPAYSMVTASERGVSQRWIGYFGFPKVSEMGFRASVDTWSDLLRTSVQRMLAGKDRALLQLSGGLDSRAIATAIPRDRRPFPALTRKADNRREVEYAKVIAERLGFEHHVSPTYTPSAAHIPAIVWRTECSISYVHSRSIENHSLVRRLADYLMGGQFGDISSGAHVAPYMLEAADASTFRRQVFAHYALERDALRTVFTDDFLDRYLPAVEEEFLTSFDRIEEEDNAYTYQVWDQIERQSNFILRAGLVNRHILEGVYPFLDVDYFNFVRSVPEKWRANQLMYRCVIHRLGPEIRDVPSANDGLRVRGSTLSNHAERFIKKRMHDRLMSSRVFRNRFLSGRRNVKAQTRNAQRDCFQDDPDSVGMVQEFVASEHCDRNIFDVQAIDHLLENRTRAAQTLLQNLATFAVGLPMFVDTSVTNCPPGALPLLSQPER